MKLVKVIIAILIILYVLAGVCILLIMICSTRNTKTLSKIHTVGGEIAVSYTPSSGAIHVLLDNENIWGGETTVEKAIIASFQSVKKDSIQIVLQDGNVIFEYDTIAFRVKGPTNAFFPREERERLKSERVRGLNDSNYHMHN